MKFLSMQSTTQSRISLENLDLELQNDEINSSTSSLSMHSNSNSSIDDDLTSLSWLIEFNKTSSTFPDSIIKPILEPDELNDVNLGGSFNNEKQTAEHLNSNACIKRKYLNNFNSDFKLPNANSKILKSVKNVSLKLNSIQNLNNAGQQIKRTNRKQSAMDRFNNFIEQVKKTKVEYDLQSDSYLIDSVNKPPFNYSQIIGMAMIENGQMTLQQICNWIQMKFSYYRKRSNWNNSIRHNLSLQFCFRKIDRNKYEKGKGGYWELAMDLKKSERKRIRNRKSTANKCKSTDQLNRSQHKIQNVNLLTSLENKNESKCASNFPSCTVLSQIIFNSIDELPVSLNKYKNFNETSKDQQVHNEVEKSIELIEGSSLQEDQNRSTIIDSQEISNAYNEILKNLEVTEDELNGTLYSNQNSSLILHNNLNEDFINSKCETKSMSNYEASNKTFLTTEEQNISHQILDEKNVIVSSYLNNLKPINGPNVIVESLPILYSSFLTRTKSEDKNEVAPNFTITSSPSSISSNSNSGVHSGSVCCSSYNCSCCTCKNTNNNCNISQNSVVSMVESQMNQTDEAGVLNSSIGCSCNNCNCCTHKTNDNTCNKGQNSVVTIIEPQMNQENDDELVKEHESDLSKCNLNCEYHQETFLLNQNIQQNLLRPFLDNIDEAFNLLRNSEVEYRSCDDLLDGIYDISVNDF